MSGPPVAVIKTYPPRGPLQQFRLEQIVPFTCARCGRDKKSKLQSLYRGDWSRPLCNGCYGRLLSLYEVQSGTEPDDAKAEQLAQQLVRIVSEADARDALRRATYSRDPEEFLTEDTLRFLGSAEYVANLLEGQSTLEWSGAIIGLCKAAERELLARFLQPLQDKCIPEELAEEFGDPDLGALARWAAGKAKSPELGTLRHSLITVANSKRRLETSAVIKTLKLQTSKWPRGRWLLDPEGLPAMLSRLTNYRNDAAHLGSLGSDDYRTCRQLVIGDDGFMWNLVDATT
jgi:hypothetical protein